jgi:hypothetical protein
MNHKPTPEQLTAIRAAIPPIENALLQAPHTAWGDVPAEIDYAEKIAIPALQSYGDIFHELLAAEISATPESDTLRREYFGVFNEADLSQVSSLNAEGFLRFLLAMCYAFTGHTSDLVQGDELKPCPLPPPPPSAR